MTGLGRRRFLQGSLALAEVCLLSGCSAILPGSPPAPETHRIGVLWPASANALEPNLEAFRQGLRELGWIEKQNISFEVRTSDGRADLLPGLAAELIGLNPHLIVASGAEGIRAARQATSTIPIVFPVVSDPVGEGFVASLARPGGNATGMTNIVGEEYTKLLLLREIVPSISRVGVLQYRPTTRESQATMAAAGTLGIASLALEVSRPEDLDGVLEIGIAGRVDGLYVSSDAVFQPLAPRIVAFAAQHRLPAAYGASMYLTAGGLITYGARIPENWRRAATFVDRILKGAQPADLPVEHPTTFDLVINLKTAQALRLTIPPSVLQRATEVIQ